MNFCRLALLLPLAISLAERGWRALPSAAQGTGRTFGDTGYRPIASLGLGLRVFLGELTVRVELRDFAYSGYISRVNGCNQADAAKIEIAEANGQTATGLSAVCDERVFGARGHSRSSMPARPKTSSRGRRST